MFHFCLRFHLTHVKGEVVSKYTGVLCAAKAMLFKIVATGLFEMWLNQNEMYCKCKVHNIFEDLMKKRMSNILLFLYWLHIDTILHVLG